MAQMRTNSRIRDVTNTTGTGNVIVAGVPPDGYRTFSAVCSVNDFFHYTIVHQTLNEWEVGFGVYSATNTIQRVAVYSSSNSNALVNFNSGTKDIFLTESSEMADADPLRLSISAFSSTAYITAPASWIVNTTTPAANNVSLFPAYFRESFTATKIGVSITTGVSGNVRLGVYRSGTDGGFTTLVVDSGDIAVTTTAGLYEATISQRFTPGLYYFAYTSNVAPTLRSYNASLAPWGIAQNSQVQTPRYSYAKTYGAFSADITGQAVSVSTNALMVYLRV